MAKLEISDLTKHSYTELLIQKIINGVPLLLAPESKKEYITIEPNKDLLQKMSECSTKEDYENLLKEGSRLKKVFKAKNKLYAINNLSKENVKVNARKGDANSTKYQENGSLKIIELIIKENRKYTIEDIAKIYPDIVNDKSWLISYEAQYLVFKDLVTKYKLKGMKIFNRDGGFMDYITKLVKKLGFSQKDSWNPADIWLLKDSSVQKKIEKLNPVSIQELNNFMIELFNKNELVGISLKKTGKTAKYELNNISKGVKSSYPFIKGKLLLSIDKSKKFKNDEFSYDLEYDKQYTINVQVRMFPKKEKSNVQVSYKVKGANAEMGKVPAALRNQSLKKFNYVFPTGKSVPDSLDVFMKEEKTYEKMIKKILQNKKFITEIKSVQEGIQNIIDAFSVSDRYGKIEVCTKLQGLKLAYYLSSLKQKDLDNLLTEWGYLSQKKGDSFGPFIKVY